MPGTDPKDIARRRSARASKAAGQVSEHPPDIAAYLATRRNRPGRRVVATPGSRPDVAAAPPAGGEAEARSDASSGAEPSAEEAGGKKRRQAVGAKLSS